MTVGTSPHRELGLTDAEYELICEKLGREPNDVELAMFSLLGVGITNLAPASEADPGSLIDPDNDKRAAAERAMDRIRAKFGGEAVGKGRGLNRKR